MQAPGQGERPPVHIEIKRTGWLLRSSGSKRFGPTVHCIAQSIYSINFIPPVRTPVFLCTFLPAWGGPGTLLRGNKSIYRTCLPIELANNTMN